jgi:hypothetical protein
MRPRRVSGGRIQAWRSVLGDARRHRRHLASVGAAVAVGVVLVNVPLLPAYERGLLTGAVVGGGCWVVSWFVWVTQGHAARLNGLWAEDDTNNVLAKHRHVLAMVPSLKFPDWDVDAVAIAPAGVFAVETKWRGSTAHRGVLEAWAATAATDARTLRNFLAPWPGLPGSLVRPLLVVCGPAAKGLTEQVIAAPLGPVTVIPGRLLESWLNRHGTGPVGTDYARDLGAHLHRVAEQRDALNVDAGPVLRWLARTR